MSLSRQRLWQIVKVALAVAIIVGVARHFAGILSRPELDPYPFDLRLQYLVPAGLLYLAAHCSWAWFWVRLLRYEGVPVSLPLGLRAYFVSQLGKYIPGKAWVILIRVGMLRSAVDARPLVVGVTATYETLTSAAAGAMLGLSLLPWVGVLPEAVSQNLTFLAAFAALPVVLGLVNRVAARKMMKAKGPDAPPLPSPPLTLLVQGLLHGVVGWCLLGLALVLAVRAVAPQPPALTPDEYLSDLGAVSLAYVSGFIVLVAPGGLGVRELILEFALRPQFVEGSGEAVASAQAAVIALVLRLTWTVAEMLTVLGLLAWRPKAAGVTERSARRNA
jgi:hypothetical protein